MCLPFKILIGNYIESIEKGADTILITGSCGPCRFGMYSILQRDILYNLGYDVDIIVLESPPREGLKEFKENVGKIIKSKSLFDIVKKTLNQL